MNKKNKIIYWLYGPSCYKNSGIGIYSSIYFNDLEKILNIKQIFTKLNPKSFLRILWNFLYIPFKMLLIPKEKKIFYDEGWLPILIYPIKNIIFIIHDIRDFNLTVEKPNFLQKIYFKFIELSLKKLNSNKVIKIICPSHFTKNKLVEFGINENKIEVIYNPVNQEYKVLSINKDALKKSLFIKYNIPLINLGKKMILNIGTEESRKNIITILKTVKNLDNYIFIKVGNPVIHLNRKKHLDYISKNEINNYFIKNLNTEEVVKFYNVADLYINTSLFEGFGRTVLEGLSCGCPVLSTYNSGLKEVLGNIKIKIDNPLDTKEILFKIKMILTDESKKDYLVKFGIEHSTNFTVDKNIDKWFNILK